MSWPNSITIHPMNYFFECRLLMLKSQCSGWIATITYIICLFTCLFCMYIPNLSVVCFFICLSYFIFDCVQLLFCAQAWHGKTLSSRNDPIFFCSLHWRNLSLCNKITTTHFKQIRFWWKNVIKFRGKVYSNFFKFVQQLFFLSALEEWERLRGHAENPPVQKKSNLKPVNKGRWILLTPTVYWCKSLGHAIFLKINRSKKIEAKANEEAF